MRWLLTLTIVCRLLTEILSKVHSCNDIQFSEDGTWTPVQHKSLLSKDVKNDDSSPIHAVLGRFMWSYIFFAFFVYICHFLL